MKILYSPSEHSGRSSGFGLTALVRRLSAFAWGWEIARTKDHAMLVKCHEDNCRSISQLAHELGQARDAERLVRMQLAAEREFTGKIARDFQRAVNAECSCGGNPAGPNACPACMMYHRLTPNTTVTDGEAIRSTDC